MWLGLDNKQWVLTPIQLILYNCIIAECDPESKVAIGFGAWRCKKLKYEWNTDYWYFEKGEICVFDLGCKHTFGGIKIINYVQRYHFHMFMGTVIQEGSAKKLREVSSNLVGCLNRSSGAYVNPLAHDITGLSLIMD